MDELEKALMAGVSELELEQALMAGVDEIEVSEDAPRTEPLTEMERFIFQNIFDTQPEKRRQYAREIGLELDPKDDNKFRSFGSNGDFQGEIDPGIDAYFKKGALKEIIQDMGDIGFDTLVSGALATGGAVSGGAAGLGAGVAAAPATAGASAAVLPILGAFLGGTAGNAAAEEMKNGIANLILDKELPMDRRMMLAQSAIVGAVPVVGQGAKNLGRKVLGSYLSSSREAAKEVLKQTGKLGDEAIDKVTQDPKAFTKEAVSQGEKNFSDFYKQFFGLDPEQDIEKAVSRLETPLPDSAFGQKLQPLRQAQQVEIDKISALPQGNFTKQELAAPIESEIIRLKGLGNPIADEKKALKTLSKQAKSLEGMFGDKEQIDFRTAKEFLRGFQDSAFKSTAIGTQSQNPVVSSIAGRVRRNLDEKAKMAGSTLPEINAQMSNALETYKMAAKNLKPKSMVSYFGAGNDRDEVRTILGRVDDTLGSDYSKQFESGALKSQLEKVYKNAPVGSSQTNQIIAGEAAKSAKTGAFAGLTAGGAMGGFQGAGVGGSLGALVGGAKGLQRGRLLANPEKNISEIAGLTKRIEGLDQMTGPTQREQFTRFLAGRGLAESTTPTEPSDDELERRLLEGVE